MDRFAVRPGRKLRSLALSALAALFVHAQQPTGEIHLLVVDSSGSAMSAAGTLRNLATATESAFQTDAQGRYDFKDVPPGRFQLAVSKTGFATQMSRVDLPPGGSVSRTVALVLRSQATSVDVVSTTPLPGSDLSKDQIPSPVQTATAKDIENAGALDLSDLLNKRINGVHVNQNQENPYQPDINYRGYTASPLLGTPEGISVYLDGVRQNQPFGDIVAWDLIPKVAILEVALVPGSNPLFGLNTLGAAIAISTKDGHTAPGTTISASGGSFGRRAVEAEHGGSTSKGWNWYLAGNLFREDGWRQQSPSEVRQIFGKLGWIHNKTSLSLSFGYAGNWLTGNGLQDARFLTQRYSSVYSIPDITWNHSPSFNLAASHQLTPNLLLSGNAYFRYIRADTTNGNINSQSFDQSLYNLSAADVKALTAAGYSGFPTTGTSATEPFPFWRCIAQGLEKADPSDRCTGLITNTFAKQNNYGLSGQASWLVRHNHLAAGLAWDRGSSLFQQGTQYGYLNPDRLTITPINAFADGSTSQSGVPVDTRANLHGLINTFGAYATDTLTLGSAWALTFSGRYNRTGLDNADRLPVDPTGARGSLNGNYLFRRVNPSAGITYRLPHWATAYFSYSEASRAPTSIELGCANPNAPCNLPNALVSDPPLKQVVTRTLEAGLRSSQDGRLRWSAGWFRGENYNDLLFVASQQTGFGYFTNFGKTLRQGTEISLSRQFSRLTFGGDYTFLNATYQSPQTINGAHSSSNDAGPGLGGDIDITPGDRIPLIPRNLLKIYADYQPTSKTSIDFDFIAAGRSFARGNENNRYQPDGKYYLGPGFSPGYGVVNLGAHYQLQKRIQLFVQIDNLLNHRYYTAAQLGASPYDNSGNFIARPFPAVAGNYPLRTSTFFAPGAPIGTWGGIRFKF
jgi:outer membrane receptor protein involved in Fe transport